MLINFFADRIVSLANQFNEQNHEETYIHPKPDPIIDSGF